jgi:hypothetical protein
LGAAAASWAGSCAGPCSPASPAAAGSVPPFAFRLRFDLGGATASVRPGLPAQLARHHGQAPPPAPSAGASAWPPSAARPTRRSAAQHQHQRAALAGRQCQPGRRRCRTVHQRSGASRWPIGRFSRAFSHWRVAAVLSATTDALRSVLTANSAKRSARMRCAGRVMYRQMYRF